MTHSCFDSSPPASVTDAEGWIEVLFVKELSMKYFQDTKGETRKTWQKMTGDLANPKDGEFHQAFRYGFHQEMLI